jgi:hypothetical protein
MPGRDWEGPLRVDPIVEQWGTGGQVTKPLAPADYDQPVMSTPPPPEYEPEPPPVEPEDDQPVMIDWFRLILWLALAALAVLAVLAVWVVFQLMHAVKHTETAAQPGTWASSPHTGTVFSYVVVVVVCVVVVRAAARWISGR